MKYKYIFYCILFFSFSSNAQTAYLQWAKGLGETGLESCTAVDIDIQGNIYLTGTFTDTTDLDPGPGKHNVISKGSTDVFVIKLNSSGNMVWAKTFGDKDLEVGNGIKVDGLGNVYTVGYFDDTVDFDPGSAVYKQASAGASDIFIQKLDANGNFVWAKRIGGNDEDRGHALALDASGNIYVTGCYRSTVDFNPGTGTNNLTTNGNWDIFILKLDASGNYVWAKGVGSTGFDIGYAIAVDAIGNVYSTGYFTNTVDFDPSPSATQNKISAGTNDMYVLKLNSTGNYQWAIQTGGTMFDYGYAIATDASGNVYTAGDFNGTVDLDPGSGTDIVSSLGQSDIFSQKLDANGNYLWGKHLGGAGIDHANGITLDVSGNVYTVGSFSQTVDFDPGVSVYNLTSLGVLDGFVHKMDGAGNYAWAKKISGKAHQESIAVAVNTIGNVYTIGHFTDTTDFTFNTGTSHIFSVRNTPDVFIDKISQCTLDTGNTSKVTACKAYTWIDGNTYTSSDTIAYYISRPGNLCDSVIFLDLIINPAPDNTITANGVTLTSNAVGASYQWINCNGFTAISGATNQSFTATASGSYAVVVTDNVTNCKDTSNCIAITMPNNIQEKMKNKIVLYPNPTSGTTAIQLDKIYTTIFMQVFNPVGQLVYKSEFKNAARGDIDLTDLPAGIYKIQVFADNEIAISTIAKQ